MTSDQILQLTRETAPVSIDYPAADRLVAGKPEHRTWSIEETENGLYCGLWQSTPGAWRVQYDEWEYVNILEGHSRLISEDGSIQDLKAGERYIIRPGFRGIWEVIETTLKDYVIYIDKAA